MTRPANTAALALATVILAALVLACSEPDTATRLEGQAPYYTSLDDALAAVGEDQYIVVDFYSDW